MTKVLSRLLNANEPNFSLQLAQLEQSNGYPHNDVSLTADLAYLLKNKLTELGLNPDDVTAEELYEALRVQLISDEQKLRQFLGLPREVSSRRLQAKVIEYVESLKLCPNIFAIKHSVIKRLLLKHPPKRTLKVLGYRSLESMLRHEPIPQLLIATRLTESIKWQSDFMESHKALKPSDFELRPLRMYSSLNRYWQAVTNQLISQQTYHPVMAIAELGSVIVLPLPATTPASAITQCLLLLEAIGDVAASSAYLKLNQVKADFGQVVYSSLESEPSLPLEVAGRHLPWRILQTLLGEVKQDWQNLLGPQIEKEDLKIVEAETIISRSVPGLGFWQDCSALMLLDNNQSVSFNTLDVALDAANQVGFAKRSLYHGRQQLWQRLLMSYIKRFDLNKVLSIGNEQLAFEPESINELEEMGIS